MCLSSTAVGMHPGDADVSLSPGELWSGSVSPPFASPARYDWPSAARVRPLATHRVALFSSKLLELAVKPASFARSRDLVRRRAIVSS